MTDHKINSIELREDASQRIDDVVVEDVTMFRMEHMDSDRWWIKVYTKSGHDLVLNPVLKAPPTFEVEGPNGFRQVLAGATHEDSDVETTPELCAECGHDLMLDDCCEEACTNCGLIWSLT